MADEEMKRTHALYVVDRLPDEMTVADFDIPAHEGHEMLAGSAPLIAVVDGTPVPLVEPLPFWGISVRVERTLSRQQAVAGLRALASALEEDRLPGPAETPHVDAITLAGDDDLSPIEKMARRTLRGDR